MQKPSWSHFSRISLHQKITFFALSLDGISMYKYIKFYILLREAGGSQLCDIAVSSFSLYSLPDNFSRYCRILRLVWNSSYAFLGSFMARLPRPLRRLGALDVMLTTDWATLVELSPGLSCIESILWGSCPSKIQK